MIFDYSWLYAFRGKRKPREGMCVDIRNEVHTIKNAIYDPNNLIVMADLADPWNYKDFITGSDIKLVAYIKK